MKEFLETHFYSDVGRETATNEAEPVLLYFMSKPSFFVLRSGKELGDECSKSAMLGEKLILDLESLMSDHMESVQSFLMSVAQEHPEQMASIIEGQSSAEQIVNDVRGIGSSSFDDLIPTQRDDPEARQDPTEQFAVYFSSTMQEHNSRDGEQGSHGPPAAIPESSIARGDDPQLAASDIPGDSVLEAVALSMLASDSIVDPMLASDSMVGLGAGEAQATTSFEDGESGQAASRWFSECALPSPQDISTASGDSASPGELWGFNVDQEQLYFAPVPYSGETQPGLADAQQAATSSADAVPGPDAAIHGTTRGPNPVACSTNAGGDVVVADRRVEPPAGLLPQRKHPKATRQKKPAVEPVEGRVGAMSSAQPAQPAQPAEGQAPSKRTRWAAPDDCRPDSGRPMCALPGHGGPREARACKVCVVLRVDACAAELVRPPGAPAAGWAFEVLQRVARTLSGTYWCPQCLEEELLCCPEKRAQLVALVRRAEAGEEGAAKSLRGQLSRLFSQTNKCSSPAHAAARNGGLCRCEPQRMWRSCKACGAARAHPYAGLD